MKRFLTLLVILFTNQFSFASHSAGAELTYVCIAPNLYEVSLQFYRDCGGISVSNTQNISFSSASCGSSNVAQLNQVGFAEDITPICGSAQSTCGGGSIQGVEQYTFQGTISLPPGCGDDWILSWVEIIL